MHKNYICLHYIAYFSQLQDLIFVKDDILLKKCLTKDIFYIKNSGKNEMILLYLRKVTFDYVTFLTICLRRLPKTALQVRTKGLLQEETK